MNMIYKLRFAKIEIVNEHFREINEEILISNMLLDEFGTYDIIEM